MQKTDVENVKQMRYMRTISLRIIVRDMRLVILVGKDAVTADFESLFSE